MFIALFFLIAPRSGERDVFLHGRYMPLLTER